MPFNLPGISYLPAFALTPHSQFDESRKLNPSKLPSGLESFRSSVSSTTDSLDGFHHSSVSSTSSGIFDPKYHIGKQDTNIIDSDNTSVSSPQASASRKQGVSLPPIRELMAPSTALTPSARTRANSLVVSPQNPPAFIPPHPQASLAPSSQVQPTRSPPQSVPYIQPGVDYGYTTTSPVGSNSPPTMLYTQQRMGSVTDAQKYPQQNIHMPQQQVQQHQHQHQHVPYMYIPPHVQAQQMLPQTPRSQSEASIVYFQQGTVHPQYYHQAHTVPQGRLLTVPINAPISPSTRGSREEPQKKEVKRRTRTGCLTCRRRRIKCDERKPHCGNCEKSKIYCAGYQTLRPTKTELKKMSKVMRVGSIIG